MDDHSVSLDASNDSEGERINPFHELHEEQTFDCMINNRLDDTFENVDDPNMLSYRRPRQPLLDRESVIDQIEKLFAIQVDILLEERPSMSLELEIPTSSSANSSALQRTQVSSFPGNSAQEAWRFSIFYRKANFTHDLLMKDAAVILRLLGLIHEALVKDIVVTKRELYYRDPMLFSNQRVVDRYVDGIARTFGIPRSMLNVSAAAKGLVTGAFDWRRDNGHTVQGRLERDGYMISPLTDNEFIDMPSAKWVLVVEKEATFRSITESVFWKQVYKEGILLTAKGYPDIVTRKFLNLISSPSVRNGHRSCAVFGLFDYDPDGISILSTYKYSSSTLAHESETIKCPTMQWIGLSNSDFARAICMNLTDGLIPLSKRDRRLATRMLSRAPFCEDGDEPSWRKEVQSMLVLNMKAEIQFLECYDGGLAGWLYGRDFESIREGNFTPGRV